MHILLTRPLEDSQELILRFKKLGHEISHMPLVKIEKNRYDLIICDVVLPDGDGLELVKKVKQKNKIFGYQINR